jgi:protein O-GlcNAc transferase
MTVKMKITGVTCNHTTPQRPLPVSKQEIKVGGTVDRVSPRPSGYKYKSYWLEKNHTRPSSSTKKLDIAKMTNYRFLVLLVLFLFTSCKEVHAQVAQSEGGFHDLNTDGPESFAKGKELFGERKWYDASMYYWRAVLLQSNSPNAYTVEEAFNGFMECYTVQNKVADGFIFIARESMQRGQKDMSRKYLEQALMVDPENVEALELQERFDNPGVYSPEAKRKKERSNKFQPEFGSEEDKDPLMGKSPEDLYEYGATLFSRKNYEHCADVFELSCRRSNYRLGPSCTNAVYCRMMILDWGFNGTSFDADMKRIADITQREVSAYRKESGDTFVWQRAASVHPHMMLGYPVDPMLKRYVAESVAFMDEMMARYEEGGTINPLPEGMPYDQQALRASHMLEAAEPGFKLKVGFVGSGFNSKAVLFLSQDIFRFYDRSKIEMHIFSCGPPDNEGFIRVGMNGVDWRERVKGQADHFHDVQPMKMDHIALAQFIREQGIHVLIEWDGYARQGERAQGLMQLRPAPVQILHQEYLGTSGAQYVDYIFTDKVASPPHLEHLYTEKFIYLPNHFFSKGHAVQKEVKVPTHDYKPLTFPYEIGTGSPEQNKCLAGAKVRNPSFVFCNFNKFLKNNPETMHSWIRILREVPGSILCLLENPAQGVAYMRRFVHEAAGEPKMQRVGRDEYDTFEPGDGDSLNDRIHFLPWERSPFEHQARNQDSCNVMLDSYPYNGHTVAQDSLYGGVPIVTRSDGDDMSSRVTTSSNIVLGLEELNAYEGIRQYEDIAIELGQNRTKYDDVRTRLIDTALQRNPMHPYWDAPRYAQNIQSGLMQAFDRYLSGEPLEHITVVESEEAGSFDDILDNNPSDKVTEGHWEL